MDATSVSVSSISVLIVSMTTRGFPDIRSGQQKTEDAAL